MTMLTEHFSIQELTRSEVALRRGLGNTPPVTALANLSVLATTILEPVRTLLGVPLHINSGYRSLLVNQAVGGAKNSAHLDGRAADIVPIGMPLLEAFDKIRRSEIPFDQLLYECASWLHIAIPANETKPRRECLLASGSAGNWHYEPAPPLT